MLAMTGQAADRRRGFLAWACLCLAGMALLALSVSAGSSETTIQGTIQVHPDFAHHIAPEDRLILKLFYPGHGVEKDVKFDMMPTFSLPLTFRISPTLDMSGQSKWRAYMVEVFTDKDHDVLSAVPGELMARTPALVPLGTTGVVLELKALRP